MKPVIIDQSALAPLPDHTGPSGPLLRDALKDALAFEAILEQTMPGGAGHIATKLRRRTLADLDIWINYCAHSERETVRRIQERKRNANKRALWEAIGGPERVRDRQRREGKVAA